MHERIIAVALSRDGKTFALAPPNRHGDVFAHAYDILGEAFHCAGGAQGFLTSTGRYVDRSEGADIAIASGQIEKLDNPPYLYSEDLW